MRSESIINLAKALLRFQSSIGTIKKDAKNPHFKSNFASLSGILDAVMPVLSEVGLVVLQHPSGDGLVISLDTILIHAETGEYMSSEFAMRPIKTDPQGIGSCITYMRRYALGAILELNIDDDDGNAASDKKGERGYVRNTDVDNSNPDYRGVHPVSSGGRSHSNGSTVGIKENKEASKEEMESVITCIDYAQTIEELKKIAKEISELDKSETQRQILLKRYNERMEYIKGGEGI